jgi:GAF domain-containing protein
VEDIRFRHNCYVMEEPYIRFYAGAPLRTAAGFNIGALCIIDPNPRKGFATASRAQLISLAGVISSRLDQLMAGPGDRTETRHAVNLEGTVSSYGKKPEVVAIHNISTRGAMIHSPERVLPRGEEVIISINTLAIVGTVMWARDGMNGLSFHRAIDDKTLEAIQNKRVKASRCFTGSNMK